MDGWIGLSGLSGCGCGKWRSSGSHISSECSARVYTCSGNVTKLSNDKIITFITYSPFHYPRCDDRIKCLSSLSSPFPQYKQQDSWNRSAFFVVVIFTDTSMFSLQQQCSCDMFCRPIFCRPINRPIYRPRKSRPSDIGFRLARC